MDQSTLATIDPNQKYQQDVRYFWESMNNGLDFIGGLEFGSGYTYNGQKTDPGATQQYLQGFLGKFAFYKFVIEDLFGEGDKVCIRWNLQIVTRKKHKLKTFTATNVLTFGKQGELVSNWQVGPDPAPAG